MLYYYLTKAGRLKPSTYFSLNKWNPDILDFWSIDESRRGDYWVCLLEALAHGATVDSCNIFCQAYGLNGQDMLEMLGRLKPEKRIRYGLERYLIEFLNIKDPTKFYIWLSKQRGVGQLADFYKEA